MPQAAPPLQWHAYADWLLRLVEKQPDTTLREIRD